MTQSPAARERLALVAIALAVSLGYYVGSQVGVSLRLPTATPSVLWPPNAILTSALILSPPRRWWVLFAAALPAHVIVELPTGWPLPLVLCLFVTNCLEALIAGGGMWLLSDDPRRFDTFPRVTVFLIAAVAAAPLLSSFADAAAVTYYRGEPYWDVFEKRLFSNVLAALVFIPAVVGVIASFPVWRHRQWSARATEAIFLGAGIVFIGSSALRSELAQIPALRAVTSQTPLALQLPFLLWAAVRFGPVGTSVALLTTTLTSAWALVHGQGPFAATDPGTTVVALTLSLIVVATTLLFLSTLVDERRHSQQALSERLRFEELLSRFSGAFVQLPSDQMDRAFDTWLGRIGETLHVDAIGLFIACDQHGTLRAMHWWGGGGFPSSPPKIVAQRDFPWAFERLLEQRAFGVTELDALPPHADIDRKSMQALGLKAAVAVPLAGQNTFLGVLACGSLSERQWSDDIKANLRLVSEVLANVLVRKQTEDALRTSELMKSAILQSLTTGVVVVDRLGSVVAHNESWTRLADQSGCVGVSVGGNLLLTIEAAARAGDALAQALAPGISSVVHGKEPRFVHDHRSDVNGTPRWWSIQVVPLGSAEGGAVIAQSDVTDVRRAELEAQRSRQELAHVARVSTVGELTASLAHQLNQPLSAIMTNAQAARRVLDSSDPDVAKLHAILVDIVKDDRRASDIIKRLRELLRRGELAMTRVNLSSLIREMIDLVIGEAIVRAVTVSIDLDHEPLFVWGDSVQLQQAMLNLLQNAIEAVGAQTEGARVVTVSARAIDGHAVRIVMRDTGPGLPAGAEEMIFEPFYTTKTGGMGMGLSIVRSIVSAHGGTVHATSSQPRGAVFELTLPIDGD